VTHTVVLENLEKPMVFGLNPKTKNPRGIQFGFLVFQLQIYSNDFKNIF
jgi:hypothetical protein